MLLKYHGIEVQNVLFFVAIKVSFFNIRTYKETEKQ